MLSVVELFGCLHSNQEDRVGRPSRYKQITNFNLDVIHYAANNEEETQTTFILRGRVKEGGRYFYTPMRLEDTGSTLSVVKILQKCLNAQSTGGVLLTQRIKKTSNLNGFIYNKMMDFNNKDDADKSPAIIFKKTGPQVVKFNKEHVPIFILGPHCYTYLDDEERDQLPLFYIGDKQLEDLRVRITANFDRLSRWDLHKEQKLLLKVILEYHKTNAPNVLLAIGYAWINNFRAELYDRGLNLGTLHLSGKRIRFQCMCRVTRPYV